MAADLLLLTVNYKELLSDFTTSAFVLPGHWVTNLTNDTWFLAFWYRLTYHERRRVVRWQQGWQQQCWPHKAHLALSLFSPNRVAWIINLYINFPADRKRHVDMSSVSHGDWSWVRWDGRGRTPHSLADAAIPVNSHILFSLPGSERVSFPSLARDGVWHRNRIRSEVTRCCLVGIVLQQTFWQLEQLHGSLWWTIVTAPVPADSMHNYHIYWNVFCYFDSVTKCLIALLFILNPMLFNDGKTFHPSEV